MILIVLIVLFILIVSRLIWSVENFEQEDDSPSDDASPSEDEEPKLQPELLDSYDKFIKIYNNFLDNWEQAIIVSIHMDTVQPPYNPSVPVSLSSPVPPSNDEMNKYIKTLSSKENKKFPPVIDKFPDTSTITFKIIQSLNKNIPENTEACMNALQWMNSKMEQAHSKMGNMLDPNNMTTGIEGFYDNDTCGEVSKCLADAKKQDAANKKKSQQNLQAKIIKKLNTFINDQELAQEITTTQVLVDKSNDVKNKAASGELLAGVASAFATKSSANNPLINLLPGNVLSADQLSQLSDIASSSGIPGSSGTMGLLNYLNFTSSNINNSLNR